MDHLTNSVITVVAIAAMAGSWLMFFSHFHASRTAFGFGALLAAPLAAFAMNWLTVAVGGICVLGACTAQSLALAMDRVDAERRRMRKL